MDMRWSLGHAPRQQLEFDGNMNSQHDKTHKMDVRTCEGKKFFEGELECGVIQWTLLLCEQRLQRGIL